MNTSELTSPQVFLATPHSFALVNIKPLLPGHVLVCPRTPHKRLTDLDTTELGDLFGTVQRVQHVLSRRYFSSSSPSSAAPGGSFNIALQDGPEAGQTVSHVHVHIIPRPAGDASSQDPASQPGDAIYGQMAAEDGNVGGALWDRQRPRPGGEFPRIEEADRKARSTEQMDAEAAEFRNLLRQMETEER